MFSFLFFGKNQCYFLMDFVLIFLKCSVIFVMYVGVFKKVCVNFMVFWGYLDIFNVLGNF